MKPLPTLSEFTTENYRNYQHKNMIDDFFEYPEGKERLVLRNQAIQRIDDIIIFHRFVMATHENNQKSIEPAFKLLNKHYDGMFDNIRHDNPEEVSTARMAFKGFDIYKQQEQVMSIANESLVINLWATIEQYATRALKLIFPANTAISHVWAEVEKKFAQKNINIKLLPSYDTINEIRVLNNKIKHSYCVDNALANFPSFSEHKGKTISEVPLRVQDYTIATYHFIIQIINKIGPSERYTDDEEENP
ncbi:hypothetical protein HA520_15055 [Azotobacter chroococcum]|uniref:Uncharacterized protein n=1 Tax=Azotobacter chroococcum TaxID=353 RepID=A0AA43Z852_9GAMM|nr:hypothetical protein [Azotobacter chroococcum]NHN78581.1 hypothetical protein [Azotobacter chroococcum]